MDKKELIKKAMKRNTILSAQEAEDAINFVEELLSIEIEHTEKTEPYATKTITDMKTARNQVFDLTDVVNEQ